MLLWSSSSSRSFSPRTKGSEKKVPCFSDLHWERAAFSSQPYVFRDRAWVHRKSSLFFPRRIEKDQTELFHDNGLSLLCCSLSQLLFQIFCPSIMAQLLKQSSIKRVVLCLARAHSSGGGICRSVMKLKHFDFTCNAFPRVSFTRLYSFPAFIFPSGMCNLQLGPTIIVAHIHQSIDLLQITPPAWGSCKSAKLFPGKEISPCSSALSNYPPQGSFEWCGRALGQPARNAVSSAALLSAKNKSGNLQWVQELRDDMESWKHFMKQGLISGKGCLTFMSY